MTDTIKSLTAEYVAWCDANNLPGVSADEHDFDSLTIDQCIWIDAFIARWNSAEGVS